MTEKDRVLKAYNLILTYFNGNDRKTKIWFKTKNPLLGNVSPFFMIYCHRIDKLLLFIESQLQGYCP